MEVSDSTFDISALKTLSVCFRRAGTSEAIRFSPDPSPMTMGLKFLAACNGTTAGGGYELALACDEILLVDDGNSAVSLPETPLLGVLPGTGGLTRVVDKRKVLLEEPIKSLGIYTVPVKLHPEVTAELEVIYLKGNRPKASGNPFSIDTVFPRAEVLASTALFSPDGDGNLDLFVSGYVKIDLDKLRDFKNGGGKLIVWIFAMRIMMIVASVAATSPSPTFLPSVYKVTLPPLPRPPPS